MLRDVSITERRVPYLFRKMGLRLRCSRTSSLTSESSSPGTYLSMYSFHRSALLTALSTEPSVSVSSRVNASRLSFLYYNHTGDVVRWSAAPPQIMASIIRRLTKIRRNTRHMAFSDKRNLKDNYSMLPFNSWPMAMENDLAEGRLIDTLPHKRYIRLTNATTWQNWITG